MSERDYKYDNIRCFLMFLVILGHAFYDQDFFAANAIYKAIYCFHMPAFFFLSGYWAKFNGKKWVSNYLYTYVLFQTAYQLFYIFVTHKVDEVEFQYFVPNYVLWYLCSLMIFVLLIPLLKEFDDKVKHKLIVVLCCVGIAIGVGFDYKAGDGLSWSRLCNFLPYFVAGYYVGHGHTLRDLTEELMERRRPLKIVILTIVTFGLTAFVALRDDFTYKMLWGKYSYEESHGNVIFTLFFMVIAMLWIFWLFLVFPHKHIPVISEMGRRTYPIFILHGFLMKYLRHIKFFDRFNDTGNLLFAFGLAIALMFLLGNKFVYKAFLFVGTGQWIEKIVQYNRSRRAAKN